MVTRLSKVFLVVLAFAGAILGRAVGELYLQIPIVKRFLSVTESQRLFATVMFMLLGALITGSLSRFANRQLVIIAENMEELSTTEKLGMISGVIVGVLVATIITLPLLVSTSTLGDLARISIWLLIALTFAYLGARVFLSMKEDIFLIWPSSAAAAKIQANRGEESDGAPKERIKILDTNVIIDGRIADIVRTGFVEGPIYVPGCVLEELHHIADSAEHLKRARGRRGLDILNQLQKDMKLLVRTYDHIPLEGNGEVDYRLVQLAKKLDGAIITNDFNLNKVAELEGVSVLNVNELANALKPVVLPGEEMNVSIIKEGKEVNQGVAYLEDGTMVVVEGGRRHIGETLDVTVTSVLQTVAGKMIFAEVRCVPGGEESGASNARGGGGTGGWQRRKGR
ncbi:MAG: TRAM domain-containing protein [Armatimonadetes bacterium]|nr:TRAM domain-containing protein [Armatimonadota bacterium]